MEKNTPQVENNAHKKNDFHIENNIIFTLEDSINDIRLLSELDMHNRVKKLDPLYLDDFFQKLPGLNLSSNSEAIISKLEETINNTTVDNFSEEEALAALRDLGLIAGSLKKNGKEINTVPKLDETLQILGNKTGEYPRDNVYSYGPRNPGGDRMRRYTTLDAEKIFIDSFTGAIQGLYGTIGALIEWGNNIREGNFEKGIQKLQMSEYWFDMMIQGMLKTRKTISPEIFTNDLRPYFDPIIIGDKSYDAPGGAQMPLIIIDMIIWGSKEKSSLYHEFILNNLNYCPNGLKEIGNSFQGKPSAIDQLKEMKKNGIDKDILHHHAIVLQQILNRIISFRMVHLQVAEANFKLRGEHEVGSGGYKPDILYHLIELTKNAKIALQDFI